MTITNRRVRTRMHGGGAEGNCVPSRSNALIGQKEYWFQQMFEFEQCDHAIPSGQRHLALDPKIQQEFGPDRIRSHSVMNWVNTAPSALSHLLSDLFAYMARPDGRCRRFNFGIYRAASPRTWMGYSAYVEFKNWSKLWTQGNATQLPDVLSALLRFTEGTRMGP